MDSMADTIVPALSSMRGNVNKMGGQTYDEFIQDPDGVEYHKKQIDINQDVKQGKVLEKMNEKKMNQFLDTGGI